jgi:hypothetical protein
MRVMRCIPMFTHNHPVQPDACPHCGGVPVYEVETGGITVRVSFLACGCKPMQFVRDEREPKEKP